MLYHLLHPVPHAVTLLKAIETRAEMSSLWHQPNWVNGSFQSATKDHILIVNPATESGIATVDSTTFDAVNATINSSLRNFASGVWSHADASTRFGVLSKAADLLRARLVQFITLETQQTNRPIREMQAQLQRVPEWLEYFASLARTHEGRVTLCEDNWLCHSTAPYREKVSSWLLAMYSVAPDMLRYTPILIIPKTSLLATEFTNFHYFQSEALS